MRRMRAFLLRLAGLAGKDRSDRELAEEIDSHLQMAIEENIRAGMTPEAARRAALLASGGLESAKEAYRERRGLPMLETVLRDLRHAARLLRRSPAHTAAAVVSLALGIGAATAILSVEKALILAPLPYRDPDRLVVVWQRPPEGRGRQPLTGPDFLDYRERNRFLEEFGVQALRFANLSGDGVPERVPSSICTAGFLRVLGIEPLMGRLFTDREETDGARVVVLSYGLWKRRFAADPAIVGRTILINREPHVVAGVMPAGFESPRVWRSDASPEIWLPVRLSRDEDERSSHWLAAIGRLKRGAPFEAAEQDIGAIAADLAREYPRSSARVRAWMLPLSESMAGDLRRPIRFLLAGAALLLLISCANVASLQFARSRTRIAEVAIRASLGAGRRRVMGQFLTEALLLAGLGGAGGILLAIWGVAALRGMVPANIERASGIRVDGWVLLFSIALTVAVGIASGLAPAFSASRLDINSALREGQGTVSAGRRRSRFQSALVVAQFALALVLANGAALMMRSYFNAVGVPLAFDTVHTLSAGISLEGAAYANNSTAQAAFWNGLIERVHAIPGVEQVASTTKLPLEGGNNGGFLIEGERYDPHADRPLVERSWITPEYFRAMGIPLVAGRTLADSQATQSQAEVVVNRTLARLYWPQGSALGKQIFQNEPIREWAGTIVGVVEDVPQWGLEERTLPEIYLPARPSARANRYLIVRAAVPPRSLERAVRQAVAAVDPAQPVSKVRSMEQILDASAARRRFNTVLFQIFAVLGAVLVISGVYGVISCYVAQRTREVGIRVALGAGRGRVVMLVLGRGLAMSAAGILIGVASFLALSGSVAGMLYGIRATSAASLAGAALFLLLIAALSSAGPALRAAAVDPARTLKAG
jgi:putative ABC transport system permease protein